MLSVDHSNIEAPPLAVKCVQKFGSALSGEVTFVCVGVCMCAYACAHAVKHFRNIFLKIFEFLFKMLKLFFENASEYFNFIFKLHFIKQRPH